MHEYRILKRTSKDGPWVPNGDYEDLEEANASAEALSWEYPAQYMVATLQFPRRGETDIWNPLYMYGSSPE